MALANVFMQGLLLFSDVGTGAAIVRDRRGDDPAFLDTAWTLHLLRGLAICLLTAALAAPVASFYGRSDPLARELAYYLPVLGLSALIDGAASTRLHRYGRHLRSRQLTLLELHNQVVSTIVMVVAAWVYPSVWALVLGGVVRSALRTGLSHLVLEGPPNHLRLEREAVSALLRFGRWVLLSTILCFLAGQTDRLVLGRLLSLEELGVYGIALALAGMPAAVLSRLGSRVLFPALSRIGDDAAQLAEARRGRAVFLGLGALLLAALVPNGPTIVDALYDDRYQAAGWLLQLLLLGSWFQVLEGSNSAVLLARGDSRAVASGNAVKLVAVLVLLPLGFAGLGLRGAVLGLVVADAARYAVSAWLVTRAGVRVVGPDVGMTLTLLAACALGAVVGARATAAGWAPWAVLPLGASGALVIAVVSLRSLRVSAARGLPDAAATG
jgi:O-antigen/teichoic acid export membrane protein